MLDYLSVCGMSAGPLFRFEDGHSLTHQLFVDAVQEGLKLVGVD